MDNFLKHFKDDIMVLHQKIGVPIVGTWVNRPQNDLSGSGPTKIRRSSKRRTKSSKPRLPPPESSLVANIAKMKVREVESALA
jgi:hypothetical protein